MAEGPFFPCDRIRISVISRAVRSASTRARSRRKAPSFDRSTPGVRSARARRLSRSTCRRQRPTLVIPVRSLPSRNLA